jgi:hypothetical protein
MLTPARYTGGALLDRLDVIVDLAGRRRGLALMQTGALAGAEVQTVATVTGLPISPASAARAGEVALLAAVGVAVGLLRVRGQRLEATGLRDPWSGISPGLRAGIVYAAWCHRMPWASVLGADPAVEALHEHRLPALRVLHLLPAAVDVDVPALAASLDPSRSPDKDKGGSLGGSDERAGGGGGSGRGEGGGRGEGWEGDAGGDGGDERGQRLAALGVAELDPPAPATPTVLRLSPVAQTVVAAALLAAGEDVPGLATTGN